MVQQIQQQHTSFRAEARPNIVAAVTFSPNYRIQGADQWQGPQYEVYRSYRPERHDQGYYRSKYQRVELIAGGYYYFHNNYWYPAYGYDPYYNSYSYDEPIYGDQDVNPGQLIANVQTELQRLGYYRYAVDGLMGPATRAAIANFQRDNGLPMTSAIDRPTLQTLGLG